MPRRSTRKNPLVTLCELFNIPFKDLADRLGCHPKTIENFVKKPAVPSKYAEDIEKIIGVEAEGLIRGDAQLRVVDGRPLTRELAREIYRDLERKEPARDADDKAKKFWDAAAREKWTVEFFGEHPRKRTQKKRAALLPKLVVLPKKLRVRKLDGKEQKIDLPTEKAVQREFNRMAHQQHAREQFVTVVDYFARLAIAAFSSPEREAKLLKIKRDLEKLAKDTNLTLLETLAPGDCVKFQQLFRTLRQLQRRQTEPTPKPRQATP